MRPRDLQIAEGVIRASRSRRLLAFRNVGCTASLCDAGRGAAPALPAGARDFRFRWKSSHAANITATAEFDPYVWSGRAVQEVCRPWLMRSCINVSGLVWGFFCQGVLGGVMHLLSFVGFFVRSERPFLRPRPAFRPRRRAQGLSRLAVRTNLAACSALARPHLDGSEHDGTLVRSG